MKTSSKALLWLTLIVGSAALWSYDGRFLHYALALIVLSLAVAIHELGHLLTALWIGVKVESYAIFAGPALWEWQWRGIDCKIGSIPIGGYVMAKMAPEEGQSPIGDSVEEKSWWQQFLFFGGGIAFNIATALVAYTLLLLCIGKASTNVPAIVNQVLPGSPAFAAGFEPGDQVLSFNDQEAKTLEQYLKAKQSATGDLQQLVVKRGQDEICIGLKVQSSAQSGLLFEQSKYERLSLNEAVGESLGLFGGHCKAVAALVTGKMDLSKSLSGPIGIVSIGSSIGQRGIYGWIFFFVIISYGVAIMNMVPIPALDGCHILFALMKSLRIEPTLRFRQGLSMVGMLILLTLILLISIKDVAALLR